MSKSKITSAHSTAIQAAQLLADQLESLEETSRISFGVIDQCKPIRGNRRIKIKVDTHCYDVRVRDISSTQNLKFYSNAENYQALIKSAAEKLGYDVQ